MVAEYLVLPHGTKLPWLAERGISPSMMSEWRRAYLFGDLDRALVPRKTSTPTRERRADGTYTLICEESQILVIGLGRPRAGWLIRSGLGVVCPGAGCCFADPGDEAEVGEQFADLGVVQFAEEFVADEFGARQVDVCAVAQAAGGFEQ